MFKIRLVIAMLAFHFFGLNSFAQDQYYYDDDLSPKSETAVDSDSEELLEEDADNLSAIEELEDIAVIQKKYLDKTGRFEFFGGANLSLNSQYFNLLGFNGVASYHLNDRWGVELQGMFLSSIERSVTEGLRTGQAITTEDIVTPTSYFGVNLRWSPVYGKMSLREKTINPFEVYFTLGLGLTGTDDSQSAFTIHAGMGQVYPMSRNTTFRWELALNNFTAKAKGDLNGTIQGKSVNANLFYLSAGVSIYFPFSESR